MGCKVKELRFGLHKCRTPDDAAFVAYPAYTNGYLILSENQKPNYLEMNMLAREILQKMMRDFSRPNIS